MDIGLQGNDIFVKMDSQQRGKDESVQNLIYVMQCKAHGAQKPECMQLYMRIASTA
jgi:hypothetical protein